MTPLSMLERSWPNAQDALVGRLSHPAAYPHAPARVTHLETHISHVFIAGDLAFKVKKPVALGFLDYSTLEKRRAACEAELRINRRLAPALYQAVVPITGEAAVACVEGAGEAIEYAVRMRAFAQEDLLDAVLGRGELGALSIDQLARTVAHFHQTLEPAPVTSAFGTADDVIAAAIQNFDQLAPLITESRPLQALTALRQWTLKEGQRLRGDFEARRAEGRIRECHGDLHLGNIVLDEGVPRIFDAIEFNDALRWIDVMSEVAFLVMDLGVHRRRDLAFRFLNQYLELTGDYTGAGVLRFYLVYRAMVRAKVQALRAMQPGLSARRARTLLTQCQAHLVWALGMVRERDAALIILHGFSGSGKTTRSMTLIETIGALRIRSDVERKRLHGIALDGHCGQQVGEGIYDSVASECTYERLAAQAQSILNAGFPVIVDAAFLKRPQRERFSHLARRLEVPFVIADFLASPPVLRARVAARTAMQTDASDADLMVLDHQLLSADALADEEASFVVPFDTERLSQREVREQARHLLNANRR